MTRFLVAASALLLLVSCSAERNVAPRRLPLVISPPVGGLGNAYEGRAYEAAQQITLPAQEPDEYSDLHNVYRLSEQVFTGSEPAGDAALQRLAEWGVKTILSVDGSMPDAETAAKYGMRYVHVPIQYKGITASEQGAIVKTFRECEGPFYVHCFHGRHRGPAAAALGRLVLDGVSREQALAEMRQWCGTSSKYSGLYWAVASAELPDERATRAFEFDFPSAARLDGVPGAMVPISRSFENVEALAGNDYATSVDHPDLDALNEAEIMARYFALCHALEETTSRPDDYRQWLSDSVKASDELVAALRDFRGGDLSGKSRADGALEWVGQSCLACHSKYRNR